MRKWSKGMAAVMAAVLMAASPVKAMELQTEVSQQETQNVTEVNPTEKIPAEENRAEDDGIEEGREEGREEGSQEGERPVENGQAEENQEENSQDGENQEENDQDGENQEENGQVDENQEENSQITEETEEGSQEDNPVNEAPIVETPKAGAYAEGNPEIDVPDASKYRTITIDASDMIFQAGGWGTPVSEGWSTYVLMEREQLKAELLAAIQQDGWYIDVTKYNLTVDDTEEIKILYAEVLNEHPELFYVSSSIDCQTPQENEPDRIIFLVWYCQENSQEEKQRFADRLWEVASIVDDSMTDVEKALVLHDYLVQHCAYAKKEFNEDTWTEGHIPDAYGALVDGKAVCQGYAEAYKALLNAVGINSEVCGSGEMNHAWNVVCLDGKWYHVDTTWDDPVWNREGRVRHYYFLVSDEEIEKNRGHHDWVASVKCTTTDYDSENYWWTSVNSQIVLEDNKYYYLKAGFNWDESVYKNELKLLQKNGDMVTEIYDHQVATWDENNAYIAFDSYLTKQGDYLYFNDRTNLYAMKLTDEEPLLVYTHEGDGYICGAMVYEEGTARLNIFNGNADTDAYITVDLKAKAPVIEIDEENETLTTTTAMEYSLDQGVTWKRCEDNMKMEAFGWDGTRSKKVAFRNSTTDGMFASDVTFVTIPARPDVISGTIVSFGDAALQTTLQLKDSNGRVVDETSVTGNKAEYLFEGVEAGSYTLEVSKEGHVVRNYSVAAGGEAVEQNMEIWLKGDVNGSGRIDTQDKRMIYMHMAGASSLAEYELLVGDVSGNGRIDTQDKRMIYMHMAGTNLLWK